MEGLLILCFGTFFGLLLIYKLGMTDFDSKKTSKTANLA
jgi:uncharacterized YccA/Bax inhibitor family protein